MVKKNGFYELEEKWESTLKQWLKHRNEREQKTRTTDEIPSIRKFPHILLAEDDSEMRELLSLTFRNAGFEVTECPDGVYLLHHIGAIITEDKEYDIIISDNRMPGISGLQALKAMHQCSGFPPMVLITAFGSEKTHYWAEQWGAAAIFDKPFEIEDLLNKICEILSLPKCESEA